MEIDLSPVLGNTRKAEEISGGVPPGLATRPKLAETAEASASASAGTNGATIPPPSPHNFVPGPPTNSAQIEALQNRIAQLELANAAVGEGEHQAPLPVATAKLVTQIERRLAGVEKDLGLTYRFKNDHPIPTKLKMGNQQFNIACQTFKGRKDAEGRPILAPPCWGFVQLQLTEAILHDETVPQNEREKVDHLRREILETPSGNPKSEKLQLFWKVCSTATVTLASKVAFVELRRHERASTDPKAPETQLREYFHYYLKMHGEVQVLERAPLPAARDLRTSLQDSGYMKGGGKGRGKR